MSYEQELVKINNFNIRVVDATTYKQAGEALIFLKDLEKKVKEYFAPIKSSTYSAWKSICEKEKEELTKITAVINSINNEMMAWQKKQEEIKKELEAKLRAEVEAQSEDDFVPPPIVQANIPVVDGLTTRENWDFEIVNEAEIPREYLIPDVTKIRGVVKKLKGNTNIPGIRVFKTEKIVKTR